MGVSMGVCLCTYRRGLCIVCLSVSPSSRGTFTAWYKPLTLPIESNDPVPIIRMQHRNIMFIKKN